MRTEAKAQKAGHATLPTYLWVALILTVVTAAEFGIIYATALHAIVVPALVILSVFKFGLVAAYFMHLKFDARLFTTFFVSGILLATAITIAIRLITRV